MKGNNTLTLNQVTMVEALQLWADAKFKQPPKVESVEQTTKGGSYGGSTFEVKVSEPEPSVSTPPTT